MSMANESQIPRSTNFYKDLKTVLLSMSTLLASSSNVIDFLIHCQIANAHNISDNKQREECKYRNH